MYFQRLLAFMGPNQKPCPTCSQPIHRQSRQCQQCRKARAKYVDRECKSCHKLFRTHESQIARGGGIYCSRSCKGRHQPARGRERVEVKCEHCGTSLERRKSEIKKSVTGKFYCNSKCWYANNRGENHYGFTGADHSDRMSQAGRMWRRDVIKRDGGRCKACMSTESITAHHIQRYADRQDIRWELSNGIALCWPCHSHINGKERQYQEIFQFMAGLKQVYCETEAELRAAIRGPYSDYNEDI